MNPPGGRSPNRALFWPGFLIVVGVFALLVNLQVIPTDRLYRLGDLWPVLLIVAGLLVLVRRSPMPAAAATTAMAVVVVLAVAGAGIYVAVGPAVPGGTHTLTTSEPVGSLKEATLEVNVGSSTLHVQGSTSLVQDLFQARITYSGPPPTISLDPETGRLVIAQSNAFGFFAPRSFQADIQLNTAVRWTFAVHEGASSDTFDLPNVQLAGMEIDTGASTEDLVLPAPTGSVPIRVNGGALTVHLHRPSDAAASVRVSGGAVSLNFDGQTASAVGEVEHSTGPAGDMYDVTVSGGTCTVTMDTGSGLD